MKCSKDVLERAILASRNGPTPGSKMSTKWRAIQWQTNPLETLLRYFQSKPSFGTPCDSVVRAGQVFSASVRLAPVWYFALIVLDQNLPRLRNASTSLCLRNRINLATILRD
jgi:hypothetical protein